MKNKLDARGKGEYFYDLEDDFLIVKIKNREYKESLEFDNLVVDIDTKGFITGFRIFDASQVFKLEKNTLKHIKEFEFHTQIKDKLLSISLNFKISNGKNQVIQQGQDFVREAPLTKESEVICSVA
ncbi:MAG TPA: DUF2283 domain-containing protein [Candidatus Nanoarchaeia archaeon]|nr:DUF2283 domain-containing protein [Candidatus Nanoarchaeia archaeon]